MPQNKSSGGLMAVEGREFNQTTFSPWTQLYTPQETSSITQQKVTLWIYFHMNFIWLKKPPKSSLDIIAVPRGQWLAGCFKKDTETKHEFCSYDRCLLLWLKSVKYALFFFNKNSQFILFWSEMFTSYITFVLCTDLVLRCKQTE